MTRMLRTLGLAALLPLVLPAVAAAAEEHPLGEEQVTLAMMILIVALIALLGIAVAFENRGKGH